MSALLAIENLISLSESTKATISEAADMAKAVFGGGGMAHIADLIRNHEWGELVDVGISDVAKCIAIADPPLATIAPLVASIIIYARHHPESVESPAMRKAAGTYDNPWDRQGGGALDTGVTAP